MMFFVVFLFKSIDKFDRIFDFLENLGMWCSSLVVVDFLNM